MSEGGNADTAAQRGEGWQTSLTAASESNIPFICSLVSILAPTICRPPCLLPLRPLRPLYPALPNSLVFVIQAPTNSKKLPTSSNPHLNQVSFHDLSNSISGSSQRRSSAAEVHAGLRVMTAPSRAGYSIQDQMPLMPLHGAPLGDYTMRPIANVFIRSGLLHSCLFQVHASSCFMINCKNFSVHRRAERKAKTTGLRVPRS